MSLQEAFNGQDMRSMEELRNTAPIPKPILQVTQQALVMFAHVPRSSSWRASIGLAYRASLVQLVCM